MIYTAKFSRLNKLADFLISSHNCLIISAEYKTNFNYCVDLEICGKTNKQKLERQFPDLILSNKRNEEIMFRVNAKHRAFVIHLKRLQKKKSIELENNTCTKKEENEEHNNFNIARR